MRVILGAEYDRELHDRLTAALSALGAKKIEESRGVGGSQELYVFKYLLDGAELLVEIETYIGISLSGEEVLISKVAKRMHSQAE